MFNLILVIIAIALVIAMTYTSVFHGGSTMTDNVIQAEAAKYRNEASQISGAVRLYKVQGNEITESFSLQNLVDLGYMKSLPDGWEPGSNIIMRPLDASDGRSEEICFEANSQAQFTFLATDTEVQTYTLDETYAIPQCNKTDLDSLVPCCVIVEEPV